MTKTERDLTFVTKVSLVDFFGRGWGRDRGFVQFTSFGTDLREKEGTRAREANHYIWPYLAFARQDRARKATISWISRAVASMRQTEALASVI